MDISFRKITIDDVDDFLALERTVDGSIIYSAMTDRQDAIEEIAKNTVYFIEKDNNIVGNMSYEIKGLKIAYISGLMVSPQFQGQGIGKQAMVAMLKELKDLGMETIELVTHPRNIKALMIYLSLGFELSGWEDNYFGDGEPRVKMIKRQSII